MTEIKQWLVQRRMMRRHNGRIFLFTLPDGRKMLNFTEYNSNPGKRKARLFEVKAELDVHTNEPIEWNGATLAGQTHIP